MKIDTGMHRVGVWPPGDAPAFAGRVEKAGLEVEGLWTHFARSEEDEVTTKVQLDAVPRGRRCGPVRRRVPAAAPRREHRRHDPAPGDRTSTWSDPGSRSTGSNPHPAWGPTSLRRRSPGEAGGAVKRLAAGEAVSYGLRYQLERDAWIATVPVGYADGYPPQSTTGEVLIAGRRCRVAGTVTMDQLIVDCGDDQVGAGDEVVLIGHQGEEDDRRGGAGRLGRDDRRTRS